MKNPALHAVTALPVAEKVHDAMFVPQASQIQSGVDNVDLSPNSGLQTHFPLITLALGVAVEAESSSSSLF